VPSALGIHPLEHARPFERRLQRCAGFAEGARGIFTHNVRVAFGRSLVVQDRSEDQIGAYQVGD